MTHLLSRLIGFCAALVLSAAIAFAQDTTELDYDAWQALASRAEQSVEEGSASDSALESLRAEIVGWRQEFLVAQDASSSRIANLQAQLDVLGAPPEEGASESAEIAERRAELNDQLARLRAPVRRAEEAYTRADGIISEIDTIIRDRQTDELLNLGPSPVNPKHWTRAIEDFSSSMRRSWTELSRNLGSEALRSQAQANLPLILLLVAVAITLLARGQRWARAGVNQLRGATVRGTGVWRFVLSLGQILLPFAGIWALSQALFATGMIGPRWTIVLEQVPFWALLLLGIRWLADQSFNANDDIATITLDGPERFRARAFSNLLALTYVARDALQSLIEFDNFSTETAAVLDFPLLALSGYFLFRLGRVRNRAPFAGTSAALVDDGPFRLRFARLLGRSAMIVGVVGPIMAAIGYFRVGEALVYPFIASLAIIGLVLVLQRVVNDLYELVTGESGAKADSLIPVLVGFVLVLLALPPLALVWGARVADLTEIWARFREGFQMGETRISPTDFLVVAVVFVALYMLTRLLQGGLRSSVLPKTKLDTGAQNAIVSGVGYFGIFLATIIAVTAGGLDLSSLAIVAGALSVGIGFGLQNIVSNFVSGIILLIERPISEGDWIEVGGRHGIVKDISVRSTRIETFDRFDVIVPNADLVSGQVTNYTRGNLIGRVTVPVGVAYGNDTRKVERILLGIARDHDMVLMNPAPSVVFSGFGADSLDFEIRAVVRDIFSGLQIKTEMNHQINERFAKEGIEIPFAQRDIWIRNPEALTGAKPPAAAAAEPSASETGEDPEAEDKDAQEKGTKA
ncbi:DUF3772 domain-containing protein [Tropicibacter oceani]|uniref:DUF3772 domain-containing protein n=1 Tax=Tropicibacter oceani TaxID=3058420 RepID=A0ABY8QEW8_9RHOB|nr:DUF3772 domain-containing protein [Tropicibacter oceani]WGW03170.1 DUF3772 domain-containing protein [Tropicibacter oceani]